MTGTTRHADKKRGPNSVKTQGKSSVMTTLEGRFGALTDDELIADLSIDKSLRDTAKNSMDYFGPERGHHQALIYYLSAKRPQLLERLEGEAKELARNWPKNFKTLNASIRMGGWWANALLKQFRNDLRERMHGLPVNAWVEAIWEIVPDFIETHGIKRVPSEAEAEIYRLIHLPSSIHYDWVEMPRRKGSRGPLARRNIGANLAPEIRKALRHRLKVFFEQD